MAATYKEWIEAFQIFAKYGDDTNRYCVNAQHEEVCAGPDPEVVSEEDRKRLEELGWHENSEGGFKKFT